MAVIELEFSRDFDRTPALRLVPTLAPAGPTLAQRQSVRRQRQQTRRRVGVASLIALTFLALLTPASIWGGINAAGASADVTSGSVLASGNVYVVQPGDTLTSLGAQLNPTDPRAGYRFLVHLVRSTVITPGEHLRIP